MVCAQFAHDLLIGVARVGSPLRMSMINKHQVFALGGSTDRTSPEYSRYVPPRPFLPGPSLYTTANSTPCFSVKFSNSVTVGRPGISIPCFPGSPSERLAPYRRSPTGSHSCNIGAALSCAGAAIASGAAGAGSGSAVDFATVSSDMAASLRAEFRLSMSPCVSCATAIVVAAKSPADLIFSGSRCPRITAPAVPSPYPGTI